MSKFGKHYPVLATKSEKDRMLFFAAAILALSLVVILIAVIKPPASTAKQEEIPIAPALTYGSVTLYAPAKPVRAGQKLSSVEFKELFWPRNQVPEGAVRDISEVSALYAKVDLSPGTPIVHNHLTTEQLSDSLPVAPGMRAVAIQVDEESSVEFWATPGTHVDVVLTSMEEGMPVSSIIVQNVRILAVGGKLAVSGPRSAQYSSGHSTLTLEVTPDDNLKIQTAKPLGRISLLMRTPEDDRTPEKLEMRPQDYLNRGTASKMRECKHGTIRMGNRNYIIGCDNKVTPVSDEP